MSQQMSLRDWSYSGLVAAAKRFLREHNSLGMIPVPIEFVVDIKFEFNIVPVDGLLEKYEVYGYLAGDLNLRTIYVDQGVYRAQGAEYWVTLAHEIAHFTLHPDVYKDRPYHDVDGWREYFLGFPIEEYQKFEWQANTFAELVLVPSEPLAERFDELVRPFEVNGKRLKDLTAPDKDWIVKALAIKFDVLPEMIASRIDSDGLWER